MPWRSAAAHPPHISPIRSTGPHYLKAIRVTAAGEASCDYVLDTAGTSTLLPPGGNTGFSVNFKPVGLANGNRLVVLRIASNDEDEKTFAPGSIRLRECGLRRAHRPGRSIATRRCDSTGRWGSALAAALCESANLAGLYTDSKVHALHIDTPVLARDSATRVFKLTIGMQKSSDLLDWDAFPFNSPGTVINGDGEDRVPLHARRPRRFLPA